MRLLSGVSRRTAHREVEETERQFRDEKREGLVKGNRRQNGVNLVKFLFSLLNSCKM